MASTLYHGFWIGLDLLLPPNCGGCAEPGSRWCPDCQDSTKRLTEPLCQLCGIPSHRSVSLCWDCQRRPPRFRALRSWSAFEGPLRLALHRLKYRRDVGLGEALAPELSEFAAGLGWCVDLVVPVPLARSRLHERGYNQVALIARPLSMALRLPYASEALVRTRETRSQVGLTKAERHDNVHGAFEARPSGVTGRRVLIVDDVATTGSTLSSCAEALYASGARDVFALTVARAFPGHVRADV